MKIKVFETTFNTYTVDSQIGEGGAGYIFKVNDAEGIQFALKILKEDQKTNKDKYKRFKNEIAFCINNNHPNIIKIFDTGYAISEKGKTPFYVMPFYNGSLRKLIAGSIDLNIILPLFGKILDGVEAAHMKNSWHRDLKPENILLTLENKEPVIADFGIAHFVEDELITLVETKDTRMANFQYAAPEQKQRGGLTDNRTDIFALGLILNELFTKEIPQGTKYKTIGSISKEYQYLDDVVEEMISQSPENRPSSINAVKKLINIKSDFFLTSQKISKLDSTVIPSSEIDDPIVADPIKLIDRDWDENTEILTLVLSQNVNKNWKKAFVNMESTYSSLLRKGPEVFELSENKARINARANEVQQIIDYFKSWLPMVANRYESILISDMQAKEDAQRQQIQTEKEKYERKKHVLESTHI
jgi:serine/threonine protein kinase